MPQKNLQTWAKLIAQRLSLDYEVGTWGVITTKDQVTDRWANLEFKADSTASQLHGMKLILHLDHKGRVRIVGGFWKTGQTASRQAPSNLFVSGHRALDGEKIITVALSREPWEVAKDIQRRLLPAYQIAWVDVWHEISERDNQETAAKALANDLAKIADDHRCRVRGASSGSDRIRVELGIGGGNWYGDLDITPTTKGPSVQFDLRSLSPAMAQRVIKALYPDPEGGES